MMEGGDLRATYPGEQYGFVNQPQQPQQPQHHQYQAGPGQPGPFEIEFHHPQYQSPNEFAMKENWDIRELAAIFLKSYYQLLETGPQYLYRFHGEDTDFTHDEGRTVTGLEQIKIRLAELNYQNNIAEINYYDAFEAVNKTISIMIIGKMTSFEGPMGRPFVQMLVLNLVTLSSRKYYVKSDVLKYLDSIFPNILSNFNSSTSSPISTPMHFQQQQHMPKYQNQMPPPQVFTPCPYSFPYHPSMYTPEAAAFAAPPYGQIPPHLYQPHPFPPHSHFPYPAAVSLSGRDLHMRNEMNMPVPQPYPVVLEDNKNAEQNYENMNKEMIEQQNMNSMIHTNNEAAGPYKQNEAFLEKGTQIQKPENCKSPSLKRDDMRQSSTPVKIVFQNEVMNLSKASSISSTSLQSLTLASPTFNKVKSPPSCSGSEPKINKDIPVPVTSLIIENSNSKIEQQKQHMNEKVKVEKKKQEKLIPNGPINPNNGIKEQKVDDKDNSLLAEAFPLYDPKSKQQSGTDYQYNSNSTSLVKKSVLSYKDKVLAPAAPQLPPRPQVSKQQPQFSSTASYSSSTIKIKPSASQVVQSGSAAAGGGLTNKNNTNNQNNKNQRNNNSSGSGNQKNNYNNGNQRNNYNNNQKNNNNNNSNNYQKNNYSNNTNNNNNGNGIEKIPEGQLSFKPAKNEEEALEMIYSYPDKYQIFVGNLPTHINDDDISKLFSTFGEIIAIKIKKPHANHSPTTPFCAFLVFKTEDAVQAVLKSIEKNHMFMPMGEGRQDRRLNIEAKQTRPRQFVPHPRTYQQTTWKRRTDYGNNKNNNNSSDNNQQQQQQQQKENKE